MAIYKPTLNFLNTVKVETKYSKSYVQDPRDALFLSTVKDVEPTIITEAADLLELGFAASDVMYKKVADALAQGGIDTIIVYGVDVSADAVNLTPERIMEKYENEPAALNYSILILDVVNLDNAKKWAAAFKPLVDSKHLFVQLDIAFKLADSGANQHFLLAFVNRRRVEILRFRREMLAIIRQRRNASTLQPFDQHLHGAVRQLQHLQNRRHGSNGEKIVYTRLIRRRFFLRNQHDFFIMVHGRFEATDRFFPPYKQGYDHVRINHHIAQRQYGDFNAFRTLRIHRALS